MVKKAKEFQSGDFIFAKVKGYPAWPARVQSYNGKKYFVYFYGTGETANLPANMIFDYAENKAKFLTKAVKRRDFNEGAKQIELDFANNTPLEQILVPVAQDAANDTMNDSAIDESMDVTADVTADDTVADTTASTQNDTAVEDSDDPGLLVIDEAKQPKGRKSAAKTPAKEAVKNPKTPRGKAKKDDAKKDDPKEDAEEGKKEEEIVSRSGRKIRPKRYIDEEGDDSALSSSMPKKRRAASTEKDKEERPQKPEKTTKSDFNNVALSELEDLKKPFKAADPEKENILMAYLPTGTYVGIKLFQSRPTSFKNDAAKLQWDRQAASNAITLKMQLERDQISPQSIIAQLVMDLNLTDEEKAALDKERETEEKKCRVNFLKTEMKLIELDAKIKSCLCLEKADTDLCLKLLDELGLLNIRPLMLLKHPTCLETVKRMRAYVGNTPSWDLSESDALLFGKQAHRIRKQADSLYSNLKLVFSPPPGLSFWEYFSERVLQFKRATAKLTADELLELVHEPLEMTQPTSHTMQTAIDMANIEEPMDKEEKADTVAAEETLSKEKAAPKKKNKAQKKETPKKVTQKKDAEKQDAPPTEGSTEKDDEKTEDSNPIEAEKESEKAEESNAKEVVEMEEEQTQKEDEVKNDTPSKKNNKKGGNAKLKKPSTPSKPALKRQSSRKQAVDTTEQAPKPDAETPEPAKESAEPSEATKDTEEPKNGEEDTPVTNGDAKEVEDDVAAKTKAVDNTATDDDTSGETQKGKEKEKEEEPRAKRSRTENKKTDVAPKSPARTRKAKV